MSDLERIEKELDEARIPREVFIGTDSTADRVTWLLRRRAALEKCASGRFETFAVEFGILAVLPDQWLTVDEIHDRLGYPADRDELKRALTYLYERDLIVSCNDGLRGNLYASKEVWTSESIVFQAERAYQAGDRARARRRAQTSPSDSPE